MDSTAGARKDDSRRDAAARETATAAERAWLRTSGRVLDERAFLAALGRGGAQRMAIPLQEA